MYGAALQVCSAVFSCFGAPAYLVPRYKVQVRTRYRYYEGFLFQVSAWSCARLQASGSIEWAEVSGSPARGQLRSRGYVVYPLRLWSVLSNLLIADLRVGLGTM